MMSKGKRKQNSTLVQQPAHQWQTPPAMSCGHGSGKLPGTFCWWLYSRRGPPPIKASVWPWAQLTPDLRKALEGVYGKLFVVEKSLALQDGEGLGLRLPSGTAWGPGASRGRAVGGWLGALPRGGVHRQRGTQDLGSEWIPTPPASELARYLLSSVLPSLPGMCPECQLSWLWISRPVSPANTKSWPYCLGNCLLIRAGPQVTFDLPPATVDSFWALPYLDI